MFGPLSLFCRPSTLFGFPLLTNFFSASTLFSSLLRVFLILHALRLVRTFLAQNFHRPSYPVRVVFHLFPQRVDSTNFWVFRLCLFDLIPTSLTISSPSHRIQDTTFSPCCAHWISSNDVYIINPRVLCSIRDLITYPPPASSRHQPFPNFFCYSFELYTYPFIFPYHHNYSLSRFPLLPSLWSPSLLI